MAAHKATLVCIAVHLIILVVAASSIPSSSAAATAAVVLRRLLWGALREALDPPVDGACRVGRNKVAVEVPVAHCQQPLEILCLG
eukprot:scaffold159947_cov19-Tisochrysis_lutea.AAC.2